MDSLATNRRAAWWGSVILHLGLVLVLAWVLGSTFEQPPAGPERAVEIVLASRGDRGETEFTDRAAAGATPAQTQTSSTSAALPKAATADSLLSGFQRPEMIDADAAARSAGNVVQTAQADGARQSTALPGRGDADVLAEDAIRNRPPGPTGPTAILAPFGMAAEGRSFVLLIDRSQSMGRLGALSAAERELVRVLDNLAPTHKFQIIAYNEQLSYFHVRRMAPATDENKTKAKKFLRSIVAARGTDHQQALLAGLRQNADVLFLFSDAEDPPLAAAQLRRIAAQAAGRTLIHAVHFGIGPPAEQENFTATLARMAGGEYGYVDLDE